MGRVGLVGWGCCCLTSPYEVRGGNNYLPTYPPNPTQPYYNNNHNNYNYYLGNKRSTP